MTSVLNKIKAVVKGKKQNFSPDKEVKKLQEQVFRETQKKKPNYSKFETRLTELQQDIYTIKTSNPVLFKRLKQYLTAVEALVKPREGVDLAHTASQFQMDQRQRLQKQLREKKEREGAHEGAHEGPHEGQPISNDYRGASRRAVLKRGNKRNKNRFTSDSLDIRF